MRETRGALVSNNPSNRNLLQELAHSLAAGGDHSTAIALRSLAQAGYGTLEEVDHTPDLVLLSLRGIGTRRLGAVRRLTRPSWSPPSQAAIEAVAWFLGAARFAALFFSPGALSSAILNPSARETIPATVDQRLAMDAFSQAARRAAAYCTGDELIQLLEHAWHERDAKCHLSRLSRHLSSPAPTGGLEHASSARAQLATAKEAETDQETDHFAYRQQQRLDIVNHYRAARNNGKVENKDSWARCQYGITGRTLLNYEREFPE